MDLLDRFSNKRSRQVPPMQESDAVGMDDNVNVSDSFQGNDSVSGVPTAQVSQMREQGYSDNQIIQVLRRDGFNSSQVFDAFAQANLKSGAPVPPEAGGNSQFNSQNAPPQAPEGFAPDGSGDMPPPPPPPQFAQQSSMHSQYPNHSHNDGGDNTRERIEELAEVIIDEKWEELIKSLNKIVEWKDSTEVRIGRIEQQFKDIKSDFDSLHKAIIGKVGEYDQNILNVGTEIKAMEKVLQKVLPAFTENIAELSRITKKAKTTMAGSSKKK